MLHLWTRVPCGHTSLFGLALALPLASSVPHTGSLVEMIVWTR